MNMLVDDLTTDGRTKETINQALSAAQAKVIGVYVLFDYKIFPGSVGVTSLMTLADIVSAARQSQRIGADDLSVIERFLDDPRRWSRLNGGIATIR